MSKEDGGPAFPRAPFEYVDAGTGLDWKVLEQGGMSLRDWFAGMILQGMYASQSNEVAWPSKDAHERMADVAFSQADAMLKARENDLNP